MQLPLQFYKPHCTTLHIIECALLHEHLQSLDKCIHILLYFVMEKKLWSEEQLSTFLDIHLFFSAERLIDFLWMERVFIRKERMHGCLFLYIWVSKDVCQSASGRMEFWHPVKCWEMWCSVSHHWQLQNLKVALFFIVFAAIDNRLCTV